MKWVKTVGVPDGNFVAFAGSNCHRRATLWATAPTASGAETLKIDTTIEPCDSESCTRQSDAYQTEEGLIMNYNEEALKIIYAKGKIQVTGKFP